MSGFVGVCLSCRTVLSARRLLFHGAREKKQRRRRHTYTHRPQGRPRDEDGTIVAPCKENVKLRSLGIGVGLCAT